MQRKFVVCLMILTLMLLAVAGTSAQDSYTIGLSLPSAEIENVFYGGLIEGAQAKADDLGAALVVLGAEGEIDVEATNIQSLIDQGIDLVLMMPVDASESIAAIESLNAAEIPVILLGTSPVVAEGEELSFSIAASVMSDNMLDGQNAATFLCEQLDSAGTVLELTNSAMVPGTDSTASPLAMGVAQRNEGFTTYMSESCADITVVSLDLANLTEDEIQAAIGEALGAQTVNGVFAYDDETALNAIQAGVRARQRGLTIVGFNPSENALGALQTGRLTGLVSASPTLIGETAVQTAVDLLSGSEIDSVVTVESVIVDVDSLADFRGCPGGC